MLSGYFTAKDHVSKIIRLICITWAITKVICYKLWLADRLFPLIPVDDRFESIPPIVHTMLFVLSLLVMLLLMIFPKRRGALLLLLLELASCLLDQNRWQPWEYQFIFMIAVYCFSSDENDTRVLWQLLLASLFFFSGINKINSAFIHDIWQGLILKRGFDIHNNSIWLTRAGYILPVIEMAAAVGLLLRKFRKVSIWILALMHGFILLLLGPAGLNMNSVIWPWNILMPVLLFMIFYKTAFEYKQIPLRKPFSYVLILFWWILPWLQLAGYWDKYLSAVLYSGGVEQLFICTESKPAKEQLGSYFDNRFGTIPCSPVLSVYKWGMKEMNTVPYPEPRIFKAIMTNWKKRYADSTVKFYLYKPGFSANVKEFH